MSSQSFRYLGAFMDELVRSGTRHIVISPGSRSTPLALLAAEHPDMKVWLHVDERSAGFFALGMAKARREPVALLCTSGTAAANYMPAVVEASLSRVPLIVLTADRPHELRDVGAPQTIDQIGLYGSHVKWFMEMPLPEATQHMYRHARMAGSRAAATAMAKPRGPVHLNFPLREPLVPDLHDPELFAAGRNDMPANTEVLSGISVLTDESLQRVADWLGGARRGVIVCGPYDEPGFAEAVTTLAEQLHMPILADPLSQLRSGPHGQRTVIAAYDAFLRDESTAERLKPDVLIRFGAMPVSKPLLQYMNRHDACPQLVVDEGGWRDPTLLASHMIHADPIALCRKLIEYFSQSAPHRTDKGEWLAKWLRVDEVTRQVLDNYTGADALEDGWPEALFEGRIFPELKAMLPQDSVLFAGNSMPIRDLDTFYSSDAKNVRIMGNRGANGIDGLISSAAGIATAGKRTVLVVGDLSFYHDMNGLLAAKLHHLPLTIIIVNNDGGGIFSFLPQAGLPRHFEELFGTPIGLDYSHAAALYGGSFTRARSWDELRAALAESERIGGLQIIEIPTHRQDNVEQHRRIWQAVSQALAALAESRSDGESVGESDDESGGKGGAEDGS